jgi:SAM-dependent methyltransferase
MLCRVCGNSDRNRTHVAREMMFGLRDEFSYIECSVCGCLQIAEIPENMATYYPANYYSYAKPGSLSSILRRQRASYTRSRLNLFGAAVAYLYGPDNALESVSRLYLDRDVRILDVGCGSGGLLLNLQAMGFKNLTGIDPFLSSDSETNGVRLLKKELSDLEGEFDLVMLHHTFEHMPEPAPVLKQLNRILSPSGTIILRIPLSGSYAWNHYGVDWFQLDAPRHFFLHTEKSLSILAAEAGLIISETRYDSTLLQFVISEQYTRDIPQVDKRSYTSNPFRSIFSVSDIRRFNRRARELNQTKEGDSACFYLRKIENRNA